MEVNLRKELVLFVVVLLLCVWIGSGYLDPYKRKKVSEKNSETYTKHDPLTPFVAAARTDPGIGTDIFLEPSPFAVVLPDRSGNEPNAKLRGWLIVWHL